MMFLEWKFAFQTVIIIFKRNRSTLHREYSKISWHSLVIEIFSHNDHFEWLMELVVSTRIWRKRCQLRQIPHMMRRVNKMRNHRDCSTAASMALGSWCFPSTHRTYTSDQARKEQFLLDQGLKEWSDQNSLPLFSQASEQHSSEWPGLDETREVLPSWGMWKQEIFRQYVQIQERI